MFGQKRSWTKAKDSRTMVLKCIGGVKEKFMWFFRVDKGTWCFTKILDNPFEMTSLSNSRGSH